jgi:transcriptional regulator with XRE-family HTH domain
MSGLAQRFRRAREAGNISIDQVARATRIKSRYLNAIEDGDFAQLPDGPAGRGFIKNYARFLGLDPEEALLQFEAEFGIPILQLRDEVPPLPERVPMVSEYTRVAQPDLLWKGNLPNQDDVALDDDALLDENATGTGITVPEISGIDGNTGKAVVLRPSHKPRTAQSPFRLRGSRSSPVPDASRKRPSGRPSIYRIDRSIFPDRGPLMPVLGAVAVLALVGVLAFVAIPAASDAGWFDPPPTATPDPAATPDPVGTPTPEAPPLIAPRITILAPVADAPGAPGADAAPDPNAPRTETVQVSAAPDGGFQLALYAREQVFVKIIIDGSLVFQGVSELGRNPTWSASRSVTVESGNAGAFDVIVNNERRGPPGAANERVRITYSLF